MPIKHATTTAVIGGDQWNEDHDLSGLELSEIGIAQGSATLNFSTGENESTVSVTGQDDIAADAKVKAWIMADDTTADHTANDHRFIGLVLTVTCGNIVAGTNGSISCILGADDIDALLTWKAQAYYELGAFKGHTQPVDLFYVEGNLA